MSTAFDVYPAKSGLPRFAEVVSLAERRLREFAEAYGLGAIPGIHYSLHDENEKVPPIAGDDLMQWPEKSYVCFQFGAAAGGTDAYFRAFGDEQIAEWERELEERERARRLAPLTRQCIGHRIRWWFRRSAGQPAIVNLGYGYLAAALAEVTGGFVYSDDNAWDFGRFPCTADEFYRFYFRPSEALDKEKRDWSSRNIEALRTEGMEA